MRMCHGLRVSNLHKAFILGAGLGTRLRPMTDSLPKPLIPFHNEPLTHHVLRHCQSAGIDSFAVNTHHLADCWQEAFPANSFEGSTIDFFHEEILLETGGGIKNIAPWIGNDAVLVYNGDILTDLDLKGLIHAHEASGNAATLALFSEGPNCNVAVDGDKIVDMRHSLGVHSGTHQFTGIYIIEPAILELIPADEKISIVPAFLELIKQGKLGYFLADGASWQDLGTREEYLSAHQSPCRETPLPAIHPTAQIHSNCDIDLDSCFIGANCVLESGAKLRNTIVWPGATVTADADLDGCIVRHSATGTHRNADL